MIFSNKILKILSVIFALSSITVVIIWKTIDKKYLEKYEKILKILITIFSSLCGASLIVFIYNNSKSYPTSYSNKYSMVSPNIPDSMLNFLANDILDTGTYGPKN
jgi:hypothetical protein